MSKVGEFKELSFVPPIDFNIDQQDQNNLPAAIKTIDELLTKTKDEKHKANYLNNQLQTNGPVISAYEYLCDYFGIAFRCSAEGISELLKKLKTLKQENVENIPEIVESHNKLIKLIIKAKKNNPTIKKIEQNLKLISTINIKILTNKEKIYLLNVYSEYFPPKGIHEIMDTLGFEAIQNINPEVFYYLSKESLKDAMKFLNKRRDKKKIFRYLSSMDSNFIKNCIKGGLWKEIRKIMDTLSLEELEKINPEVFYYLSKENPKAAMNFLNKIRDKEKVFIYLFQKTDFIKIFIEHGFAEKIRKIMDTFSLKELKQIGSNVWNIFSKENPKEAMKFLNNRKEDKKAVFIFLFQETDFIENSIDGVFVEEIRDIIFELNLQNDESFKNVMKKLKEKNLVQKTGIVFFNRKWEKI